MTESIAPVPGQPGALVERAPRLALRFAIYSGIVLLVVGFGILWVLQRDIEHRAENRADRQTRLVAEEVLRKELRAADFVRPVSRNRNRTLDAFFADEAVGSGLVRATLFNRDGVVTYSTDDSLIGRRQPTAELAAALAGSPSRGETTAKGRKLLRTFVPVRNDKAGRPVGAIALSQDYHVIDLQVHEAVKNSAVVLGLALLALWGSLIPILRRTTRQLKARNSQLAAQAQALADTLRTRDIAEQRVREFAAIVEASDDAIIGTDMQGIVVSWNDGAERLFGFRAAEAVGSPISILVPPDRGAEVEEILTKLRAGETVDHFETVRRRKDGTPVDISLTISPIRDGYGDITGTAAIARDITQRKRYDAQREALLAKERAARTDAEAAQRALAEQNERLRELDRLKDEFISLVSHELRTPLTSIHGYLELLLDGGAGDLSADQERFLAVVERNSKRLMQLVGDLLFMAQVEAGKLALEVEPLDLDEIVREAVEAAQPMADDRQISLVTEVVETPPMLGDRSRLMQVLDNLISNGLKFTRPGGEVAVRVSVVDGVAVVEVADTGVGIPAAEQGRLFERFFRSSTATEQAIPGTGLGLTIAKTIVERHGGTISIRSEVDAGTTAEVRLPVRARSEVAEEVAA